MWVGSSMHASAEALKLKAALNPGITVEQQRQSLQSMG